jgi:hypothetical protein
MQTGSILKNVYAKKFTNVYVVRNTHITILNSTDITIYKHTRKVHLKTRLIENSPSEHNKMSEEEKTILDAG